ncbi:ABC transporter permease [Microlunatus sp. GCM10028923]|uniref:ABC transporter permease n=1 Tax=Microlunatus sp. GCM10028923 TaxID=3273400 RepID=UPI003614C3B3
MTASTEPAVAPDPAPTRDRPPERLRRLRHPRVIIPAAVVGCILIIAAVPDFFAGWFGHPDPRACDLSRGRQGPQPGHPFGFDLQGCDLYANVIHGTRSSVLIGLLVTLGCVLIAVVLGSVAAYYRGWLDVIISRAMDIIFGFPSLVGMVVILTTLQRRDVAVVSAVLILFGWPGLTRLMRGSALGCVELGYVRAAAGLGASGPRVIIRHVLPNAITPVLVLASLNIGGVITAESALTFLGVGLKTPAISWGVQLNVAQDGFRSDPHLLLFPAAFLSITVLAFVLLGDALRHALDPKQAR